MSAPDNCRKNFQATAQEEEIQRETGSLPELKRYSWKSGIAENYKETEL